MLYGGMITVITSIFLIAPETANGGGAVPLVTDGTVPVVGETLSEPAPGVNDAAKASEDVTGGNVRPGAKVSITLPRGLC